MTLPSPLNFELLIISGGLLVLGGLGMLANWGRRRSTRTKRTQSALLGVALIVLLLGASTAYIGWRGYAAWSDYANSASVSYETLLEPNGSGQVRLSLPIPSSATGLFMTAVHIDPASSKIHLNESGPEPALDIEISGRSWVNFSMGNSDPNWRQIDVNLTRTGDLPGGCELWRNCTANLGMRVVEGAVNLVHVRMNVAWSYACTATSWELVADVASGAREYEGRWRAVAC